MSTPLPVGLAQPDDALERDSLTAMLDAARRRGGRGSLRAHRELWRYCGEAFREWHGAQLVSDRPIILAAPLTKKELVDLLRLADQVPALIRDLLALHAEAHVDRRQVALRLRKWPDDRRQMLAELHQIALFSAGIELQKAQRAQQKSAADFNRGNYHESCKQRQRMVTACERQIATLQDQLHTLTSKS